MLQALGVLGGNWGALGAARATGKLLGALGATGSHWKPLGGWAIGGRWGAIGGLWGPLGPLGTAIPAGGRGGPLGAAGGRWGPLGAAGKHWPNSPASFLNGSKIPNILQK